MYPLNATVAVPDQFPSPFNNHPHSLAVVATQDFQLRLPSLTEGLHDFAASGGGKMLGVLVVKDSAGGLGYLAGFSGMLGGRWSVPGFVPPLFDDIVFSQMLAAGEREIRRLNAEIDGILTSTEYAESAARKQRCDAESERALTEQLLLHRARKLSRHRTREQSPDDNALHIRLAAQSREDKKQRQQLQKQMREMTDAANGALREFTVQLSALVKQRKRCSANLQRELFDLYAIGSVSADTIPLRQLFSNATPPGGAGDCAAVKLLHEAIKKKLTPVCLAEFWWGCDAGLRHHGQFYASCRSKCRRILPHMLCGLEVTTPAFELAVRFPSGLPEIVFEDDAIVVVNKPAGMLSVPGHAIEDSVEYRLRQRYPVTDNPTLLVHRLDQGTSGLLLAAKNARCYKALQHQFQCRAVDKTYMAEIESTTLPAAGQITLPLRVDLEDRPRQIVCYAHGKQSLTRFTVDSVGPHTSIVIFKPVTGRTHQLRVHAAHPHGLGAPIVGDELYGMAADRLHLHAQRLAFTHPLNAERMTFSIPAPFMSDGVSKQ